MESLLADMSSYLKKHRGKSFDKSNQSPSARTHQVQLLQVSGRADTNPQGEVVSAVLDKVDHVGSAMASFKNLFLKRESQLMELVDNGIEANVMAQKAIESVGTQKDLKAIGSSEAEANSVLQNRVQELERLNNELLTELRVANKKLINITREQDRLKENVEAAFDSNAEKVKMWGSRQKRRYSEDTDLVIEKSQAKKGMEAEESKAESAISSLKLQHAFSVQELEKQAVEREKDIRDQYEGVISVLKKRYEDSIREQAITIERLKAAKKSSKEETNLPRLKEVIASIQRKTNELKYDFSCYKDSMKTRVDEMANAYGRQFRVLKTVLRGATGKEDKGGVVEENKDGLIGEISKLTAELNKEIAENQNKEAFIKTITLESNKKIEELNDKLLNEISKANDVRTNLEDQIASLEQKLVAQQREMENKIKGIEHLKAEASKNIREAEAKYEEQCKVLKERDEQIQGMSKIMHGSKAEMSKELSVRLAEQREKDKAYEGLKVRYVRAVEELKSELEERKANIKEKNKIVQVITANYEKEIEELKADLAVEKEKVEAKSKELRAYQEQHEHELKALKDNAEVNNAQSKELESAKEVQLENEKQSNELKAQVLEYTETISKLSSNIEKLNKEGNETKTELIRLAEKNELLANDLEELRLNSEKSYQDLVFKTEAEKLALTEENDKKLKELKILLAELNEQSLEKQREIEELEALYSQAKKESQESTAREKDRANYLKSCLAKISDESSGASKKVSRLAIDSLGKFEKRLASVFKIIAKLVQSHVKLRKQANASQEECKKLSTLKNELLAELSKEQENESSLNKHLAHYKIKVKECLLNESEKMNASIANSTDKAMQLLAEQDKKLGLLEDLLLKLKNSYNARIDLVSSKESEEREKILLEKDKSIAELGKQLEKSESAAEELADRLKEKEEDMRKIKETLDEKVGIINELSAKLKEKEDAVQSKEEASEELRETRKSIVKLSAEIDEKDKAIEELSNQLSERGEIVEELSSRVREKEDDIEFINKELEENEDAIVSVNEELRRKDELVAEMTKTLGENEELIGKLREDLKRKEEIIASKDKNQAEDEELKIKEKIITKFKESVEILEKELKEKASIIELNAKKIKEDEEIIEAIDKRLEEKEEALDRLNDKLDEKESLINKITAKLSTLLSKEKMMEELGNVKSIQSEMSKLLVGSKEGLLKMIRGYIENVKLKEEQTIGELKRSNSKLENQCQESAAHITSLKEDNDKYKRDIDNLQQEVRDNKKELEEATQSGSTNHSNFANFQEEIAIKTKQMHELQEKYNSLLKEKQKIKNTVTGLVSVMDHFMQTCSNKVNALYAKCIKSTETIHNSINTSNANRRELLIKYKEIVKAVLERMHSLAISVTPNESSMKITEKMKVLRRGMIDKLSEYRMAIDRLTKENRLLVARLEAAQKAFDDPTNPNRGKEQSMSLMKENAGLQSETKSVTGPVDRYNSSSSIRTCPANILSREVSEAIHKEAHIKQLILNCVRVVPLE